MLKRTTKEYKNNFEFWFFTSLNLLDYVGDIPMTKHERVRAFADILVNETYIKRANTIQDTITEYLLGMPSALDIPCYYYQVLDVVSMLTGVPNIPTNKEDTICQNYYKVTAIDLIRLFKGYNIELTSNGAKLLIKEI